MNAPLSATTPAAPDIRDIKGLVPVPHHLGWLWALLAVAVLAAAAVWWWRRRRQPAPETNAVPRLSPYELATQALQRLREDNPPVEPFYTRLADIVRVYLEGRFGLRAPERTTEEFLSEVAQDGALSRAHQDLLAAFLGESDLVKFARHQPSPADQDRAFAAAERFIAETGRPVVVVDSPITGHPSPTTA